MVSALDALSCGPGSSPGWGTALCPWAKYFTPIVLLYTRQIWGNPLQGLASHPGGKEILLVASCYRIQSQLRPDVPLESVTDLTYLSKSDLGFFGAVKFTARVASLFFIRAIKDTIPFHE